jgi:hypothetical protein
LEQGDVGGIDLQGIDVKANASSALKAAPVDMSDFNGFSVTVSSLDDTTSAAVFASLND